MQLSLGFANQNYSKVHFLISITYIHILTGEKIEFKYKMSFGIIQVNVIFCKPTTNQYISVLLSLTILE